MARIDRNSAPVRVIAALVVLASVGVIAALALRSADPARDVAAGSSARPIAPSGTSPATGRTDPADESGDPAAARESPRSDVAQPTHPAVARYMTEQALQARLRRFFADAGRMPTQARRAEASALVQAVTDEERAGFLLPPEALALRLALLRHLAPDDAAYAAEAARLTAAYRERSDAMERASREAMTSDPRFVDYKKREAAIVAEVMQMPETVDGRARADILRERLVQARRDAWAAPATSAPAK